MDLQTLQSELDAAREALFERREERPRPSLDDKILTDWNGLMIAGLATAGRILETSSYIESAATAASFLLDTLRDDDGRLLHRYRQGDAAIRAHLDDYAMLTWGLVDLYAATFDPRWLREAVALTDECLDHFWDANDGGFFNTADDAEALIVRQKDLYDGARPSGNSVQYLNLIRLGRLTGDVRYDKRADALANWAGRQVDSQPGSFTGFLMGTQFEHSDAREVVIAGNPESGDTQTFLAHVRNAYRPFTVALLRSEATAEALADLAPFTKHQTPIDGQATAYVCHNHACDAPTTDPSALDALAAA